MFSVYLLLVFQHFEFINDVITNSLEKPFTFTFSINYFSYYRASLVPSIQLDMFWWCKRFQPELDADCQDHNYCSLDFDFYLVWIVREMVLFNWLKAIVPWKTLHCHQPHIEAIILVLLILQSNETSAKLEITC